MQKVTLALVAAMAVVCARAEAAVYTTQAATSFVVSSENLFNARAYVPAFNDTLGTLNTTTIRLTGNVAGVVLFRIPPAPTSGVFYNRIQFYNVGGIGLSPTPIINSDPAARSIQNNFSLDVTSTAYNSSLREAPGQPLDVSVIIDSVPSQGIPSGVQNAFTGTIFASYNYTPVATGVSEPVSAALVLTGLVGLGFCRRRIR